MSTRLENPVFDKQADHRINPTLDRPGIAFTNKKATGPVVFTLPAPNRALQGWWYEFRVIEPFAMTVQTIDGASPMVASSAPGQRLDAWCDGKTWLIVADIGGGGGSAGGVPPDPHGVTHETGGSDAVRNIDGTALTSGLIPDARLSPNIVRTTDDRLVDARLPIPHAASHALAGSDPVLIEQGQVIGLDTTLDGKVETDDPRLSDSRPPTVHASTHQPGGSDPLVVDAIAGVGSLRTLGTGPQQAVANTDARLTDARLPLPHAVQHASAGADPVSIVSLAGYPGGTTGFLRADRTWAVPPGGSGGGGTPGGSNQQVQFNEGGVFAGSPNLTFDKTEGYLTIGKGIMLPQFGAILFRNAANTAYLPQIIFNNFDDLILGDGAGSIQMHAPAVPAPDAALDLGRPSARWRDGYFGRDVTTDRLGVGAAPTSRLSIKQSSDSDPAGGIRLIRAGVAADYFSFQVGGDNTLYIAPSAGGQYAYLSPAGTFFASGSFVTPGSVTAGGDVVLTASSGIIRCNTADGADTGILALAGGGANASTRGAVISLYGNERGAGSGQVSIEVGNVAGSRFIVWNAAGGPALQIDGATSQATFGGQVTVGSYLSVNGGMSCQNSLVFTTQLGVISRNTVDGADTGRVYMAGGGDVSQSRGAWFMLSGNEDTGLGGQANFYIGNAAGSMFRVHSGNGAAALTVDGTSGHVTAHTTLGVNGYLNCSALVVGAQTLIATAGPSKNNFLYVCGGPSSGATDGARLLLYGYDYGAGGMSLYLSSNPSAVFNVMRGDNFVALSLSNAGAFRADTHVSHPAWVFNSSHGNGGTLCIYRSDNPILFIGCAPAIGVGGTNMDAVISNPQSGSKLYLEAINGSIRSQTAYNDATGTGAANCVIEADGRWRRVTSSRRYKTGILPLTDWRWFLDLDAVEYTDHRTPDGRKMGGFTAEDVAAKGPTRNGLPMFAGMNDAGQPEDVAYANFVSVIQLALKDYDARIAALESHP